MTSRTTSGNEAQPVRESTADKESIADNELLMAKSSNSTPPTKREFPKELKREVVAKVDAGKMSFAEAKKTYGLTDHQLKAWWGQVLAPTANNVPQPSDESTQDLQRRLVDDAMAGKIGGQQLRLDILELIFKSIRQEK